MQQSRQITLERAKLRRACGGVERRATLGVRRVDVRPRREEQHVLPNGCGRGR